MELEFSYEVRVCGFYAKKPRKQQKITKQFQKQEGKEAKIFFFLKKHPIWEVKKIFAKHPQGGTQKKSQSFKKVLMYIGQKY